MDLLHYNNIFNYLQNNNLSEQLTTKEKEQIKRQSKFYIQKNGYLYKKDKRHEDQLLRVIRTHELKPILYMMHNDLTAGHFATDIMFEKIRNRYYWPQMYENIRQYVQACEPCQKRGNPQRHTKLHPIPVGRAFSKIGIDIVGPLNRTARGKKYIVVAVDYLTKWPEAKAISADTAEQVAHFIYEQIICQHGCPDEILSDRGTHFRNKLIDQLLRKFKINHLLSTPYHPQTNGLVERFNRTLCESLAKLSDKTNDWDLMIAPTLFAYRTSKQATTKIEPFYLVYGRSAKLPVDFETNSDTDDTPETLINRVSQLIDDLPQIRQQAQQQIKTVQVKQKLRHDKKLKKEINFKIGDKVLYYLAANATSYSGKLNPKWKGPYYIHNVLPNGAYKLSEMDGRILRTPTNGNLLKLYYELEENI